MGDGELDMTRKLTWGVVAAFVLAGSVARAEEGARPARDVAPLGSPVVASVKVLDTAGVTHVLGTPDVRVQALVFVGTECPIANKYLPELNALAKRHSQE